MNVGELSKSREAEIACDVAKLRMQKDEIEKRLVELEKELDEIVDGACTIRRQLFPDRVTPARPYRT